jgi:two-component system cell cycle sensor histidine kinase/response regulator CckA
MADGEGNMSWRRLSLAVLDLLPDPVIITDAAGTVLRASASADTLLGYPAGGLTGQPVHAWLSGTGRSEDDLALPLTGADLAGSQLLLDASRNPIEVRISARETALDDRDGLAFILTLRGLEAVPEPGGPGASADSTTMQELVDALRRNEERLAYATTAAHVGLFEHVQNAVPPPPPWWSPSLRAILSYDAERPADFAWFESRIHPEDAPVLQASLAQAHSPSGDGRVAVEYRWLHPEKGYRWLLIRSATVFDEIDGQRVPLRGLGAIIDVTEQHVLEEDRQRRAAILEATPDFVAIADLDGHIIDLNGAARELLGMAPDAPASGLQLSELHAPGTVDRLWDEAMPTAKAEGSWSGETEFRRHDGEVVPVAQHLLAHRDAAGALGYLSTIARDLTKEKQLEAQFRQAQKMEAVGRLAGGVAHDFNNMLSVIFAYAELVQMDLGTDHVSSSSLQEIIRAARRAESLTRQLLAFGRRQILKPRVIDINEILAEFLPMITRLVDERIAVQVIPSQQPVTIKADPNQLQQVLLNLALNARDAMPEGGELTIEAFRGALENGPTARQLALPTGCHAVITVSDTGHGMDEHTQERIFEPFFTTKGPQAGTGLGLSTVMGIVRQSGGNVWVYSELGRGTTFKLYFPCTDEPAAQQVTASIPVAAPMTGVVLVAEDDGQVRAMVGNVLARAGFEVLSAAHPDEALALAAQYDGPIDLLLTDVVMPKLSGAALAEKLRARRPELPVLYTSGYTENTIVRRGVLDEGVNFLPKPITPGRLLEAVRTVLGLARPNPPQRD